MTETPEPREQQIPAEDTDPRCCLLWFLLTNPCGFQLLLLREGRELLSQDKQDKYSRGLAGAPGKQGVIWIMPADTAIIPPALPGEVQPERAGPERVGHGLCHTQRLGLALCAQLCPGAGCGGAGNAKSLPCPRSQGRRGLPGVCWRFWVRFCISLASAGREASAALIPVCAERGRCCALSKQGFLQRKGRKIRAKSIPNGESFEKAPEAAVRFGEHLPAQEELWNLQAGQILTSGLPPTRPGLCFCPFSSPQALRTLEIPAWTSWHFLASPFGWGPKGRESRSEK